MPTYQYRCADCDYEFDIVQKFSDAALTTCPNCDGSLRKVFSPVGVVFKGSGFYATDNRTKGKANAAAGADTKSDGGSDATAAPSSDAKPSASPAAAPAASPSAPAAAPAAAPAKG